VTSPDKAAIPKQSKGKNGLANDRKSHCDRAYELQKRCLDIVKKENSWSSAREARQCINSDPKRMRGPAAQQMRAKTPGVFSERRRRARDDCYFLDLLIQLCYHDLYRLAPRRRPSSLVQKVYRSQSRESVNLAILLQSSHQARMKLTAIA